MSSIQIALQLSGIYAAELLADIFHHSTLRVGRTAPERVTRDISTLRGAQNYLAVTFLACSLGIRIEIGFELLHMPTTCFLRGIKAARLDLSNNFSLGFEKYQIAKKFDVVVYLQALFEQLPHTSAADIDSLSPWKMKLN